MKRYKKFVCCLAMLFAVSLPLSACAQKEQALTQLPILSAPTSDYGSGYKQAQGEKLHASIASALQDSKGVSVANVWKNNPRALTFCVGVGEAFEERGIPVNVYGDLVNEVCDSENFFADLLKGDAQASKRFLKLFTTLSQTLGIHDATRIGFDLLLRYCDYQKNGFQDKYDKHGYSYLLIEAQTWEENKASLQKIGEENFSTLTRCGLAMTSVLSLRNDDGTAQGFLQSLRGGEAALFMRTQGALLASVTTTEEDYAFLVRFSGETLGIRACAAIAKAGKEGEYAAKAQGFIESLSAGLQLVNETCGNAFLSGDLDGGAQMLWSKLTEEEKGKIEGFFAVENDAESYRAYLSGQKLTEQFEKYCKETTRGEVEKYVYESSPELAFLVFGI